MAAAGHAKLRRELIGMLLADRKSAIQQRNASAAITASTRIADLLLRQAEEEAAKAQPVTKLVHVIMHQRICPVCKERGRSPTRRLHLQSPRPPNRAVPVAGTSPTRNPHPIRHR